MQFILLRCQCGMVLIHVINTIHKCCMKLLEQPSKSLFDLELHHWMCLLIHILTYVGDHSALLPAAQIWMLYVAYLADRTDRIDRIGLSDRRAGEYYRKSLCSVPPECDPVPGCFCTGDTGGGTGQ
jgi:hypothetical protein